MVLDALRRGELGEELVAGVVRELRRQQQNGKRQDLRLLTGTEAEPRSRPLRSGRNFGAYYDNLDVIPRRLIGLIYEDNATIEQAAEELGLSVGECRELHRLTLLKIRREIEDNDNS